MYLLPCAQHAYYDVLHLYLRKILLLCVRKALVGSAPALYVPQDEYYMVALSAPCRLVGGKGSCTLPPSCTLRPLGKPSTGAGAICPAQYRGMLATLQAICLCVCSAHGNTLRYAIVTPGFSAPASVVLVINEILACSLMCKPGCPDVMFVRAVIACK